MNPKENMKTNPDVRCSALLDGDGFPIGRWMTFGETVGFMANFPLAERMIWDGHKNNPRPETGLVLSALEKVEPLRHAIRRAEVQTTRLRLFVARTSRNASLAVQLMSRRWLAYRNA